MANPPHAVSNERIPEHAERLLAGPVALGDLALAFSESTASSAEVLVEGDSFYPRMLEDIASASSSVHINQFGFRPGIVGDAFAEALIGKAVEGVPVRLVVDRRGSDPERGAQAFYDRLLTGGIEVCVVRAMQARAPAGPLGRAGVVRLNLAQLGHVDPCRDRGSLPGRALSRPVRTRGRSGRRPAAAGLRRQLPLARRRDSECRPR
jgi:hypothetical protein